MGSTLSCAAEGFTKQDSEVTKWQEQRDRENKQWQHYHNKWVQMRKNQQSTPVRLAKHNEYMSLPHQQKVNTRGHCFSDSEYHGGNHSDHSGYHGNHNRQLPHSKPGQVQQSPWQYKNYGDISVSEQGICYMRSDSEYENLTESGSQRGKHRKPTSPAPPLRHITSSDQTLGMGPAWRYPHPNPHPVRSNPSVSSLKSDSVLIQKSPQGKQNMFITQSSSLTSTQVSPQHLPLPPEHLRLSASQPMQVAPQQSQQLSPQRLQQLQEQSPQRLQQLQRNSPKKIQQVTPRQVQPQMAPECKAKTQQQIQTSPLHCISPNTNDIVVNSEEFLIAHSRTVQVNGHDLSKASHEEAIDAFHKAEEPIVVEVLRRSVKNSSQKMKSKNPISCTVATQTDEFIENEMLYGVYDNEEEILNQHGVPGLYTPSSRIPLAFSPTNDMGLTDIEMSNAYEYNFEESFESEQFNDFEYEEVTLHRASSEERLGLTLCYGSTDEDLTDIFISEIDPYSIAAQDGRIKSGDQILQINGIDVHSREEAIKLFQEDRSDITLLLGRQIQMDDGFLEDGGNVVLDDLHMDMLRQHPHFNPHLMGQGNDEEGATTDTATTENSLTRHEKDSGVGRTDESTKNDESSEQEMMDNESSPGNNSKFRHYSDNSFTSNDTQELEFRKNEISTQDCEKFREVLANRYAEDCSAKLNGQKEPSRKDSHSSLEQELALLNKEMEHIQLECQEIIDIHSNKKQLTIEGLGGKPYQSPRVVPRMGTRLDKLKNSNLANVDNGKSESPVKPIENIETPKHIETSSLERDKDTAYNTADSSHRSTPLTLELSAFEGDTRSSMLHLPATGKSDSSSKSSKKSDRRSERNHSRDGSSHSDSNKSANEGKRRSRKDRESDGKKSGDTTPQEKYKSTESLTDIYATYAEVMYTNQANLAHTMMVQQKLFEKKISTSSHRNDTTLSRHPDGNKSAAPSGNQSSDQMEWVVKRRADGSRYVTRRPIRNKMLKERAKKITEERAGMTTDDDAMSEMKVGKYWSREDRKRHLEKARDQKRKREFMQRSRMETLKEKEEDNKKEVNIVELSHRKMMRHKGRKVFDDFTTVQEMLVHGNRESAGKNYNPLLSVTTV